VARRDVFAPRHARRVALFVPHFSEYAARLSLAMAREAEVLFMVDARNFADECDATLRERVGARTQLLTFNSVGRRARAGALARALAALVAFRPCAILVQEQIDSLTAWVCRLSRRAWPIVLTVHDPRPHSGMDTEYVHDNTRNRRAIRVYASGFHVHGEFCRGQLAGELPGSRAILATAHGVILVPRPEQTRTPEPGRILMFGRMEAYKGLSVLLDAADMLANRGRDFRLVIAGKGSETWRLRARLAANPRVEWIDAYLTPDAAIAEFQRASIVTAPYVNATQSGVVAAAFGNGRPVIATRSGGLPDAVRAGVNGLLVTPNDPTALADAIEAMLANPELLASTTRGAVIAASSDFDWKPIAQGVLGFMGTVRESAGAKRCGPRFGRLT
jgi:glycosyltransferase involved in cell wall biosynthesis